MPGRAACQAQRARTGVGRRTVSEICLVKRLLPQGSVSGGGEHAARLEPIAHTHTASKHSARCQTEAYGGAGLVGEAPAQGEAPAVFGPRRLKPRNPAPTVHTVGMILGNSLRTRTSKTPFFQHRKAEGTSRARACVEEEGTCGTVFKVGLEPWLAPSLSRSLLVDSGTAKPSPQGLAGWATSSAGCFEHCAL